MTISGKDDVYLVGSTNTDQYYSYYHFPLATSLNSSSYNQSDIYTAEDTDAFIIRFNKYDEMLWSTYFGGESGDQLGSVCLLANDKIVVTGGSRSSTSTSITSAPCQANVNGEFPICGTSSNVVQPTNYGESDAVIAVFNDDDQLVYSTYYGGTGTENGAWYAHLGGVLHEATGAIASTSPPSDDFYVTGTTTSESTTPADKIPLVNSAGSGTNTYFQDVSGGGSDIFLARFSNYTLQHSTYFGGEEDEISGAIAVNSNGQWFFSGNTEICQNVSGNCMIAQAHEFPVCDYGSGVPEYFDDTFNWGLNDAFIGSLNNADEIVWSTYLGGQGPGFNWESQEIINSLSIVDNTYIYFGGKSDAAANAPFPQIEDDNSALWFQNNGTSASPLHDDAIIGRFEMPVLVGINEQENSNFACMIYPNPTNKYLFIKPDKNQGLDMKLIICNSLGQSVFEKNCGKRSAAESPVVIDLSILPAGLYFIQLNLNEHMLNKKIVKL